MMLLPRAPELSGHNKVPQILVGITFPQILALFFISARAYTRVKILHQWSLDDSLIMLAWISSIPISVLFGVATRYGHGHHVDDVPFDVVKKSFSIVYATVICYQVALASTKLSILVFYHRVFPGRREIWMTRVTISIVIMFSVALMIADSLSCNPIGGRSFFGPDVPCTNLRHTRNSSTICHTVMNVWIIVMVIPVIQTLKIPQRQKYYAMGVISLGLLVTVASIMRAYFINRVENNVRDVTWFVAEYNIWTVIEVCMGIICACAPTLRPLLLKATQADTSKTPYGGDSTGKGMSAPSLQESSPEPVERKRVESADRRGPAGKQPSSLRSAGHASHGKGSGQKQVARGVRPPVAYTDKALPERPRRKHP